MFFSGRGGALLEDQRFLFVFFGSETCLACHAQTSEREDSNECLHATLGRCLAQDLVLELSVCKWKDVKHKSCSSLQAASS